MGSASGDGGGRMELSYVGDTALMVELGCLDDVLRMHAALSASRDRGEPSGIEDLIPAERTILVLFARDRIRPEEVRDWVARTRPAQARGSAGEEIELPVHYEGEDLDDVGELTGLGPQGVIDAHTGTPWTVAFTGFAPGFGYLVGGDGRLRVPRLASPRIRVPAGAVALAGHYSAVYPRVSPGGWRLIGRTSTEVWDAGADPPALLRPGVRVRFTPSDG
jgi:KipI family sensor histidine kinase inhibitor